ncbi:unnamed protein product [marine sediment metagenome]|uniref:Uncharacterized protein n=1 Tax=marine sediment metagenome TaxID=412755 RepID=X1VW59_9ZZZZ
MCKPADISNKNFEKITQNVRESIDILLGFELAHIGINAENEKESLAAAEMFSDAFGFILKKGNSSNFSGAGIEVNKSKGLGTMGHIAIKTNSIARAAYYLGKKGFSWRIYIFNIINDYRPTSPGKLDCNTASNPSAGSSNNCNFNFIIHFSSHY